MRDCLTDFKFSQIYLDKSAEQDEITRRVLTHFPRVKKTTVEATPAFLNYLTSLSLTEGKQTLWLTHFKGNFLKPCPGTADTYRCCNYLVINETTNCPIDCTYCILQGYVSNPAITIYTNYQKIETEIRTLSRLNPGRILRVGTGELSDSLALDPLTRLSEKLMSTVQELPNIILELKSKTDHISHLPAHHPGKTVLSWSVNPEAVIRSDEHKSSFLAERLQAARQAAESGFMIGLHFDPIIYLPEWETAYPELIGKIGRYIDASQIAWISLGSLRYPPHLKEIVRSRFPRSRIFSGEQIIGMDGKARYLRPLRLKMYRTIYRALQETLGNVFVYFCMESEDIWQEVTHRAPKDSNEVDWYFAQNLSRKFPKLHLPQPQAEIYRTPILFPSENEIG